jgi:hypothetical protein
MEWLGRALAQHTHRDLFLASQSMGDVEACVVAAALSTNMTLRSLHLDNNAITDAGVCELARALERHPFLTSLNLSCNSELGVVSARGLSSMLACNTGLIHLSLNYNALGDAGCSLLAHALEENATLRSLQLAVNDIGPGYKC